jgi:hypothetical protein
MIFKERAKSGYLVHFMIESRKGLVDYCFRSLSDKSTYKGR